MLGGEESTGKQCLSEGEMPREFQLRVTRPGVSFVLVISLEASTCPDGLPPLVVEVVITGTTRSPVTQHPPPRCTHTDRCLDFSPL